MTSDNENTMILRSTQFRKGREEGWKQLEEMVARVEKRGIGSLSADEIRLLPILYRNIMSSLSVARNIVLDRNQLLYLENLALRAYLVVYGPRTNIFRCMVDYFKHGFPAAVRSIRWHLLIAFIALLAGIVAGCLLVNSDINYFHTLIPESLAGGRGPDSTAEELINEELFAPWPGLAETFVAFASFLFQHNTLVGIFCFGLGFALGIPTIILLLYNGLILGAFIALHHQKGLTFDFIGWLSIHGVTEILAILLCAASGLVLAEKLAFPDKLSRLDSLALNGRKAAGIVAGAVVLFFIAGILEGGFRQLLNDTLARYAVALLTGAGWLYYFTTAGKQRGQDGRED